MSTINPILRIEKEGNIIRIINETDYLGRRGQFPTYYHVWVVDKHGEETRLVLPEYDEFSSNIVEFPVDPGLYRIELFINEDCRVDDYTLMCDESILDEERQKFLECGCNDSKCATCQGSELCADIDPYIRLKMLLDMACELEKVGEYQKANCLIINLMKLRKRGASCVC